MREGVKLEAGPGLAVPGEPAQTEGPLSCVGFSLHA